MEKHSHLTLQERSIICARIAQGASFHQISAELDKDPGTISKEIRLHRVSIETFRQGSDERHGQRQVCAERNHDPCNADDGSGSLRGRRYYRRRDLVREEYGVGKG